MTTVQKLRNLIYDEILGKCNPDKTYEVGDGYTLKYYNGGINNIWKKGITLGKVNDKKEFEEIYTFELGQYATNIGEIITNGHMLVEDVIDAIVKDGE